ncbi:hypothetical protein J1N35_022011, partial [Gossypium stocksii]
CKIVTPSFQGRVSLKVLSEEIGVIGTDVTTLTRGNRDTENPQAKIMPTVEDVMTPKVGCRDIEA